MTCLSCMQRPFVVSPFVTMASWTCQRTNCRTCLQSSLTVSSSTNCTYKTMTCLSCMQRPFVVSPLYNGILDISQNRLQDLPPKLFDGFKLNQLHLQNNALSQLHAETFHGLTFNYGWSNCTLDISQNKLQDLPPKVFNGTGHLEILDLADNELSTVSDDAFRGLSSLRSLRLEGNRLRSLGTRPFYWLYSLIELNLEQNQLTDLDEDVFISRYEVEYDSYYSKHYTLKRSLMKLNLGGNRLTTLPGGLFKGFTNLRKLQLQSNQLERLPPKLFQTLGKVRWAFSELSREYVMQDLFL